MTEPTKEAETKQEKPAFKTEFDVFINAMKESFDSFVLVASRDGGVLTGGSGAVHEKVGLLEVSKHFNLSAVDSAK